MPWFFSFVLVAPMGVRSLICKSGAKCPAQRERNPSRVKCGGCNDRISLTRPRAPEIALNKSKYVEKFNLIRRQAIKTADPRTADAKLETGKFRVEMRTVRLGGQISRAEQAGAASQHLATPCWTPH